jgi:hypothetical protein
MHKLARHLEHLSLGNHKIARFSSTPGGASVKAVFEGAVGSLPVSK